MQYVTNKYDGCITRGNSNGNSDVKDGGGGGGKKMKERQRGKLRRMDRTGYSAWGTWEKEDKTRHEK